MSPIDELDVLFFVIGFGADSAMLDLLVIVLVVLKDFSESLLYVVFADDFRLKLDVYGADMVGNGL